MLDRIKSFAYFLSHFYLFIYPFIITSTFYFLHHVQLANDNILKNCERRKLYV